MTGLSMLLSGISPDTLPELQVSGFALDNRQISSGMVFVALNGTQQHGMAYAEAAIASGAVAVLYEPEGVSRLPEVTVPLIAIPDLANKLGDIVDRFYGQPSHVLSVVGVTGTDGKTSVTHFIAEALKSLNKQAAVMGTIGIGTPGALQTASHTTPDVIRVQQTLREMADKGVDTVAMEVSSHALDQGRVGAVQFDTAVLTNLTRDHLDYHGSVEAYAAAKRKLFSWPGLKTVVLNLDDKFGREIAESMRDSDCNVIGYGAGAPEDYPANTLVARRVQFDHEGIHAWVTSPWGKGELHASVLGHFNLENLLAACGTILAQGYELSSILDAMQEVHTVPGRMERVAVEAGKSDSLVVVDYAHTPGALQSVLQALAVHTANQLICVFGCGGDRDAGKRPLMAQAAEQGADQVIVTDDNPRTEDAEQIFADICKGLAKPELAHFIHDRARAIRLAIEMAGSGDTVLIAGKGHETVQLVDQDAIPFDDRKQAAMALEECVA